MARSHGGRSFGCFRFVILFDVLTRTTLVGMILCHAARIYTGSVDDFLCTGSRDIEISGNYPCIYSRDNFLPFGRNLTAP